MAVEIQEVELTPREPAPEKAPPAVGAPEPSSPDLALRIDETVALLRSRDLRLMAD